MPYVQRDGNNAVCGLYANAQPGYAEEYLEDDNSEVVAYRNSAPVEAPRDPLAELDALKAALVKKNVVSDKDIEAEAVALDLQAEAVKA
jgi:hypothetical protein